MDTTNKYTKDETRNLMLTASIFVIFLILFGTTSLIYQIQRFKRIRTQQQRTTTATYNNNSSYHQERDNIHQLKQTAYQSRKEMQIKMEKEIESLRLFQEELRGQVDMLREAYVRQGQMKKDCAAVGDNGGVLKKEQ